MSGDDGKKNYKLSGLFLAPFLAACAGPIGPQGEPGPPGIAGYEIVDAEHAIGEMKQDDVAMGRAECPPGKKVLGGGGYVIVTTLGGLVARAVWPVNASEPWDDRGWTFAMRYTSPLAV